MTDKQRYFFDQVLVNCSEYIKNHEEFRLSIIRAVFDDDSLSMEKEVRDAKKLRQIQKTRTFGELYGSKGFHSVCPVLYSFLDIGELNSFIDRFREIRDSGKSVDGVELTNFQLQEMSALILSMEAELESRKE